MQLGNFIDVLLARHVSGTSRALDVELQHMMLLMMGVCTETCRAKNTSIKLPCYIKLAFHFIS